MPYIKKTDRILFDTELKLLAGFIENPGDANYCLFKLMELWLSESGKNYANISACISAFECAKLEFYRRIAVPYEDKKMIENSDVLESNNEYS